MPRRPWLWPLFFTLAVIWLVLRVVRMIVHLPLYLVSETLEWLGGTGTWELPTWQRLWGSWY